MFVAALLCSREHSARQDSGQRIDPISCTSLSGGAARDSRGAVAAFPRLSGSDSPSALTRKTQTSAQTSARVPLSPAANLRKDSTLTALKRQIHVQRLFKQPKIPQGVALTRINILRKEEHGALDLNWIQAVDIRIYASGSASSGAGGSRRAVPVTFCYSPSPVT